MRRLLTAEPVLFLAVGGSVALIGMMLLKPLIDTGMQEWVAFAVQTVVCIQLHFAGCWFVVFRHRRQHPFRSLAAFNGVRILTGALHPVHRLGHHGRLYRLGGAGHGGQLRYERVEDLQEEPPAPGLTASFDRRLAVYRTWYTAFRFFIGKNALFFGIITEVLIVIAARWPHQESK